MTIQEQKIILRLLSREQIADLFPKADVDLDDTYDGWAQKSKVICGIGPDWYCTRKKGHTGLHIRHILTKQQSQYLPIVWINESEKE